MSPYHDRYDQVKYFIIYQGYKPKTRKAFHDFLSNPREFKFFTRERKAVINRMLDKGSKQWLELLVNGGYFTLAGVTVAQNSESLLLPEDLKSEVEKEIYKPYPYGDLRDKFGTDFAGHILIPNHGLAVFVAPGAINHTTIDKAGYLRIFKREGSNVELYSNSGLGRMLDAVTAYYHKEYESEGMFPFIAPKSLARVTMGDILEGR